MKTEEKAKRYDEALNWMRELYPGLHGATKEDAEHYFPELKESKESEDERIRRSIVTIVEQYARVCEKEGDPCEASLIDDALSYLEKQQEQKPLEWSEEDIDIINVLEYIVGKHRPDEIFKIGNKQGVSAYKICSWLKSLKNRGNFPKSNTNSPSEWSEEDKKMLNLTIEWAEIMSDQFSFADIEPKDFRKIIAWLKSLPGRFNLQPQVKQEQKPLENLQKEKIYDIIAKLTNLSYSNLIPFNSEEYKKINEITADVFDLLKYTVEKK